MAAACAGPSAIVKRWHSRSACSSTHAPSVRCACCGTGSRRRASPRCSRHTHGHHVPHLSYAVLRTYDVEAVGAALDSLPDGGRYDCTSTASGCSVAGAPGSSRASAPTWTPARRAVAGARGHRRRAAPALPAGLLGAALHLGPPGAPRDPVDARRRGLRDPALEAVADRAALVDSSTGGRLAARRHTVNPPAGGHEARRAGAPPRGQRASHAVPRPHPGALRHRLASWAPRGHRDLAIPGPRSGLGRAVAASSSAERRGPGLGAAALPARQHLLRREERRAATPVCRGAGPGAPPRRRRGRPFCAFSSP